MNKYLIALCGMIVATATFLSCNIKDVVKADVGLDMSDATFTVQMIPAGSATLGQVNVAVNVDSIIHAANSQLGIGNINSVKINSCRLEILDGDVNNNFANLSSCKAEFNSNTNTSFVTVAEITNNPDVTAYTLDLPVNTTLDLKDYFHATSFTYQVSGTARRATTKTLTCKATVHYTVSVGL